MSIIYLNGEYVALENAKISVLDRGLVLGDGLFETLGANHGVGEYLEEHYLRLEKSCEKLELTLPIERQDLRQIIRVLEEKNSFGKAVVRLTITRGVGGKGLSFPKNVEPTIIINYSPMPMIDPILYQEGVALIVSSLRTQAASGYDSGIKSTNYLANIMAKHEADERGAYDALFLGAKDEIAEMTTASFFVVENGIIKTPQVSSGILPGITRMKVIELAQKLNMSVLEEDIFIRDIEKWDGVFITSSIRGIMPVRQIDSWSIPKSIQIKELQAEFLKFKAK
tara:strand:+ start:211 stop:1056 length:846 start_codon:yes stop_codon:yes gene_type:complete